MKGPPAQAPNKIRPVFCSSPRGSTQVSSRAHGGKSTKLASRIKSIWRRLRKGRTPERQGHANGYKSKTVQTRVGSITFDIPQVREGGFYPGALEKGLRSERALTMALAEMYVQGVSTRKVKAITEQLCGIEISSSHVSRATAQLDEVLEAWRNRSLGEYVYLYLDARYEKVRQDGQVRDAAVLIAAGVNWDGKRDILGVSVALGEQEVHWRAFLQSLVQRGLQGVYLIISDAHAGLRAARQAVFGGIPWLCQRRNKKSCDHRVKKSVFHQVKCPLEFFKIYPEYQNLTNL